MCICLAATLLTHLGTVPSSKSYRAVSHCLFLACSYLSGELLPAFPPELGTLLLQGHHGSLRAWVRLGKGRDLSLLHKMVGATADGSQLPQGITAALASFTFLLWQSEKPWECIWDGCHLGVASPAPSHCSSWVTPNFGGSLTSDKGLVILTLHRLH